MHACKRFMQKPASVDTLRQLHIMGAISMDGHITDMGMVMLHMEPSMASSAWSMKIFHFKVRLNV